ncbi:Fic family protein [Methylobacterium sp. J-077]|uniref:Fic family protein n=1 Tax=Methylobacterium sp. J-077 TaxID=2836656 RepID=UPI0028C40D1B|nr:Fic family protein [Methylobacterium sp. J-077]
MRRLVYTYDHPDWPRFRWDETALLGPLGAVRYRQGRLLGRMEALGFNLRQEAILDTLTQDAVKTSEIEGETLASNEVRSSLARRLGIETAGLVPSGRQVDGIVTMVLDATQGFTEPLTVERLFGWHIALFPHRDIGRQPITIGAWRTDALGPMRVVAGPRARERVHFQAPPADRIAEEMDRFLRWFEDPADPADPVLKAAIAHVWFVTIHPFDDGNGRIGRAIADMALARAEGTGRRFYSMSARLRAERNAYYETLEATQKGDLEITARLAWFLGILDAAIADAETTLTAVLRKERFWRALEAQPVNPRQRMMLGRLLDGFEGKLTTSKWAQIATCSHDTALRDIEDLTARGLLMRGPAGGRSTSYRLVEPHV